MGKIEKFGNEHPESIVLVLQGCFFRAEGRSAKVLASITGYKLRNMKNDKVECGFSFGALDKVKKVLEDNGINYLIYQKNEIIHQYSNGNMSLDEFLKDTNIPPPISENTKIELESVTFRCPKVLVDKLKAVAEQEWQSSFDAIVTHILEKGLSDG